MLALRTPGQFYVGAGKPLMLFLASLKWGSAAGDAIVPPGWAEGEGASPLHFLLA